MPPPSAHAATETFQHYQVLRKPDGSLWELGRGAMGITYKAFDTNLRSQVALKVINAMHLDSESARGRFLREARAAAGLRHRNVASVYHLGNDDQSFFYAMEFVDGETVEGLVKRRGPLPPAEALDIVLQVARALGAAHRQGLVHRDIKPANLMVVREDEEDETLVKVIDFGLARSTTNSEGSSHITMGGFVGTPQYASPEQLQEQDLDTRSDIYSLGITLWYLVAGRPPFTGPLGTVFLQHLTKDPPWDQLGPLADGPLRALLARMLAKDPAQRPQTPLELRRETEVCLRALAAAPRARAARPAEDADEGTAGFPSGDTAAATAVEPPPTVSSSDSGAPPGLETVSTESPASTVAAATTAPAPPEVGAVLAGRYELQRFAGEGDSGRVFQARDLNRDGRLVAVKILHPGLLADPETVHALQTELLKLHAAPHPGMIAFEELERAGGSAFLVGEWVDGFTLVDLLRQRGQLSARETLRLLEPAAAVADHASAHGLERLQLAPHQILATLRGEFGGTTGSGARPALALSVERWPEFGLKLDPLGITAEAGEFVTWAGDRTLLPSAGAGDARTSSRDTQTSIRGLFGGSYLPALAALAYELLSGVPPPTGPGGPVVHRLASLPALGEEGNLVLRRALSATGPAFASGREFCVALARACGLPLLATAAPEPTAVVVEEPALPPASPDLAPAPVALAPAEDDEGTQTILLDSDTSPTLTFVPDESAVTAVEATHILPAEPDSEATLIWEESFVAPVSSTPTVEPEIEETTPAAATFAPADVIEETRPEPPVIADWGALAPEPPVEEPVPAPPLARDQLLAAPPDALDPAPEDEKAPETPPARQPETTARAEEPAAVEPAFAVVPPDPPPLARELTPAMPVPVPPLPVLPPEPPARFQAAPPVEAIPAPIRQTPAAVAPSPAVPRKSTELPLPVLAAVGGGVVLLGVAALVWSSLGHRPAMPTLEVRPTTATVQPSPAPPQPTPAPVVAKAARAPAVENSHAPPPPVPPPIPAPVPIVATAAEVSRPEPAPPAEAPALASRGENVEAAPSQTVSSPPSPTPPEIPSLETGRAAMNPATTEPADAEARAPKAPAREQPSRSSASANAAAEARRRKEEAKKEEPEPERERPRRAQREAAPPQKSERERAPEPPRPKPTPKAVEKPKPQPTPEAPQQRGPAVPFMR